jgi:hypothetical protein
MAKTELNKNQKIKSLLRHLEDKFGSNVFKIKDHWDSDLNAIGLTDNSETYLIYISIYEDQDLYFVSLENPAKSEDFPYEPAGEFNDISLRDVENHFKSHLRINK